MEDKFSTGIDLVEIDRIKESVEKNPSFLVRFFGSDEISLFNTNNSYERIAANFAAKEAFSKALGTGVVGFALKEVQVLRDEKGAPYLKLSGKAQILAKEKNMNFSVSLSHTKNYATAIVIGYNNS